jgi:hypothetical protein
MWDITQKSIHTENAKNIYDFSDTYQGGTWDIPYIQTNVPP